MERHENETDKDNLANNTLLDVLDGIKLLFSWAEPSVLASRFNLCMHPS